MENYLYFLNLDDKIVKYGISNTITNRLKQHHGKFINKLQLKNKLDIICLIRFNNEMLNSLIEHRLKKFIKFNDKYIKEYNETELFYIEEYDTYFEKIKLMINNLMKEFNLNENDYSILTNEEISDIYTPEKYKKIKKCNQINNININIINNSSNKCLCPRCGSEFSRIDSLKRHFIKEKICEPKYLDIIPSQISSNYNEYLTKFLEIKQDKKDIPNVIKITCENCGKSFTQKTNYYRHKQHYCKTKENNINKNNINEVVDELKRDIQELKNKINNTNNTNTNKIINNYGEEKYNLTLEDCKNIISFNNDMIIELIKNIHFNIKENQNIYIRSFKEKYAGIFVNQKWIPIERENLISELILKYSTLLKNILDKCDDNLLNGYANNAKNIINSYTNDKEMIKYIRSNLKLMILNRSDNVLENYKDSYDKKRIKFI